MKNFKKVLALVLVVAMMASFAVTASAVDASDYNDYDEVSYQQALDIMTAIQVINGKDTGSFDPAAYVTRAEMAKIVTCIMNNGEDVGEYYASANTFSDCVGHWAVGYIAYANKMGVINGLGGGKFNPQGNVTGLEAMKMLMVALGYDGAIQNYTGAKWDVNVLNDGREAGLTAEFSTSMKYTNAMTREQVVQMIFNALNADMVDYANRGTTITAADGTSYVVGASKPEPKTTIQQDVANSIVNESGAAKPTVNNPDVYQLAEYYFAGLESADTTDYLGRPGTEWTYENDEEEISFSKFYVEAPLAVYTAKVSDKTIVADLGGEKMLGALGVGEDEKNVYFQIEDVTNYFKNDNAANKATVVRYQNGTRDDVRLGAKGTETMADMLARYTEDGKVVEVYGDRIVEIEYTLAEVIDVYTSTEGTVYTFDTMRTCVDYANENIKDTITYMGEGELEAGDVVTAYEHLGMGGDRNVYVYPTTTVTAAQSAYGTDINDVMTVTLSGEKYIVGLGVVGVEAADFKYNSTKEATYYLDQYGNVVKTGLIASEDFLYVVGVLGEVSNKVTGSVPSITVQAVNVDGDVIEAEVALEKKNGNWFIKGIADSKLGLNNKFYVGGMPIAEYFGLSVVGNSANVESTPNGGWSTNVHFGNDKDVAKTEATKNPGKLFTYTMNNDVVTLETVAVADEDAVVGGVYQTNGQKLAQGQSQTNNEEGDVIALSNTTTYVFFNASTQSTEVYVGAANIPEEIDGKAKTTQATVAYKYGKIAGTGLVVFDIINEAAAVTAEDLAYVDTTVLAKELDADGNTIYTYAAYFMDSKDGVPGELKSATKYTKADSGMYTYKDGMIFEAADLADYIVAPAYCAKEFGKTYMYMDGEVYYITADTAVIYTKDAYTTETIFNGDGFVAYAVVDGDYVTALYVQNWL